MKGIVFTVILASIASVSWAEHHAFNWEGMEKGHIPLALPLLTIKGAKGFLGCGYLDVETCNKTSEACAIVSGVRTHDDMLTAKVKRVSDKAKSLGIRPGMPGFEALEKLR